MSGNSKIEWTDRTWNPVTGCNKVSPGCKHCYAEGVADRFFAKQYPANPDGSPRKFTDVRCHQDRLDYPLHWRKPARVFVNSMSDLFHESVPDAFLCAVFKVMCEAKKHSFQILTKRPARMREFLSRWNSMTRDFGPLWPHVWPQQNIWLGVSVENQATADKRIPLLLQTPAAVRFISAEPLLGHVSLEELPSHSGIGRHLDALSNAGVDPGAEVPAKLNWVICGGESGPDARPMSPTWARSMRDQCRAARVPFFFKQWGEWAPAERSDPEFLSNTGGFRPTIQIYDWDRCKLLENGLWSIRVGKHAAGRQLDGREWNEYPERAA